MRDLQVHAEAKLRMELSAFEELFSLVSEWSDLSQTHVCCVRLTRNAIRFGEYFRPVPFVAPHRLRPTSTPAVAAFQPLCTLRSAWVLALIASGRHARYFWPSDRSVSSSTTHSFPRRGGVEAPRQNRWVGQICGIFDPQLSNYGISNN